MSCEKCSSKSKPIIQACYSGHLSCLKAAISECDGNEQRISELVNCRDSYLRTPLHRATSKQHPEIVQYLVTHLKADTNVQDEDGFTPLHLACFIGNDEITGILINNGSGLELLDK